MWFTLDAISGRWHHRSDPLDVALVTYSTRPRGGVVHTLALAEALAALGQRLTVYAVAPEPGEA